MVLNKNVLLSKPLLSCSSIRLAKRRTAAKRKADETTKTAGSAPSNEMLLASKNPASKNRDSLQHVVIRNKLRLVLLGSRLENQIERRNALSSPAQAGKQFEEKQEKRVFKQRPVQRNDCGHQAACIQDGFAA